MKSLIAALLIAVPLVAPAEAAPSQEPRQYSVAIATFLTPLGKGRFTWEGALMAQEEGRSPTGGLVKGTCELRRAPDKPRMLCLGTKFPFTDQDSFTMAVDGSTARLEQRYKSRTHTIDWTAQGQPQHETRECPDGGSELTLTRPSEVAGNLFGHEAFSEPYRGELLLNLVIKQFATTECPPEDGAGHMAFEGPEVRLVIGEAPG